MAYPQPHPPNPNNNNNNFVRNQPGQFQRQSQQHHHHQVTLKTTELAATSVSTTTTTTSSTSSSGSSSVPSVEALCKVLGGRAAANDDDDHVRSVAQCGDGLEDELGAKVLRGRMRPEVPSGKKWTLPAPPAAIDEQDYSSGDSSFSHFEEMMMKASARRQSKWKEQFDKLANKTRPKNRPHLVEEEREGCLEKVKKKPLEKKKSIKQIRRNSTSTFSTQLPVEILQKKKKEPRRHSLFIQRVSDLLQDETGVAEVFKPRIPLNPSPPLQKVQGINWTKFDKSSNSSRSPLFSRNPFGLTKWKDWRSWQSYPPPHSLYPNLQSSPPCRKSSIWRRTVACGTSGRHSAGRRRPPSERCSWVLGLEWTSSWREDSRTDSSQR
jgi:hypothetical protein